MKGISKEGGLFIPESIPIINSTEFIEYKNYNFQELCYNIFKKYTDSEFINNEDLKKIIENSFSRFKSEEITPIKKLSNDFYILELFHGPTNSFKDIALQFIGNLYEYLLIKNKQHLNIICATSGDTGSAAIYALKNKSNIKCIVLHPDNKISNIQRKQMVTVNDKNIYNLALTGTFDDCQNIVKQILKEQDDLDTVNSINWCRVLIQITYYFYAYFRICNGEFVNFAVPTGNFGDILAGYYAKKMGLPIDKLIISTNKNDILYRFYNTGIYEPKECIKTISPAMDITISSNFERLIYHLLEDKNDLSKLMKELEINGRFIVNENLLEEMKKDFLCEFSTDKDIKEIIKMVYNMYNYICDPHTAVGVSSMIKTKVKYNYNCKTVCLATANPGKFPETILEAVPKIDDSFIPLNLILLLSKNEKYEKVTKENAINIIKSIIKK